jgi:hypothetical protein
MKRNICEKLCIFEGYNIVFNNLSSHLFANSKYLFYHEDNKEKFLFVFVAFTLNQRKIRVYLFSS